MDESGAREAKLRAELEGIAWFHRIDLGHGVMTPGIDDTPFKISKVHLPDRLDGLSVIDIGAWNGAFSFECERRGAARVLATDWYSWQGGHKKGFDVAKRALNSKVEEYEVKVEDIRRDLLGGFDVVLFLGVSLSRPRPTGISTAR